MKNRPKRTAAYYYQGKLLTGAISSTIAMVVFLLGIYQLVQIVIFLFHLG